MLQSVVSLQAGYFITISGGSVIVEKYYETISTPATYFISNYEEAQKKPEIVNDYLIY